MHLTHVVTTSGISSPKAPEVYPFWWVTKYSSYTGVLRILSEYGLLHLLGSGFTQSTATDIKKQRVVGGSQDIEGHGISNAKVPKDKGIFC